MTILKFVHFSVGGPSASRRTQRWNNRLLSLVNHSTFLNYIYVGCFPSSTGSLHGDSVVLIVFYVYFLIYSKTTSTSFLCSLANIPKHEVCC